MALKLTDKNVTRLEKIDCRGRKKGKIDKRALKRTTIKAVPEKKRCEACLKIKSKEEFLIDDTNDYGLSFLCIKCIEAERSITQTLGYPFIEPDINDNNPYYYSDRDSKENRRIADYLRRRIISSIMLDRDYPSIRPLMGCSVKSLKIYLETLFEDYMSWDNFGTKWTIDFVQPSINFDLKIDEEKKHFVHFTNLKPSIENLRSANPMNERIRQFQNIKIANILRSRINTVLRGYKKSASTIELTGCTIEELKKHLESQFDENMNWDNIGTYWHIDHIIPCAAFDLSDPEQQKQCFHYTNLQPLEASENLRKNDSLPNGERGRNIRGMTTITLTD